MVVPKGLEHDGGGAYEDMVSPEAACNSGVTSAEECASACAATKGCAGFVLEASTSNGSHGRAQAATTCTHACRLQRRGGSDIDRAGGPGRIGGGRISGTSTMEMMLCILLVRPWIVRQEPAGIAIWQHACRELLMAGSTLGA